jgi:hypothetical protein
MLTLIPVAGQVGHKTIRRNFSPDAKAGMRKQGRIFTDIFLL